MCHVSCIMYHVSCIMYLVSMGSIPPPPKIKEWSYITVYTDQTINQKMSKITNWTISQKYKSLYFRAEPKHQNIKGFKRSKVNSNLKNKLSNIFGGAGRGWFVFNKPYKNGREYVLLPPPLLFLHNLKTAYAVKRSNFLTFLTSYLWKNFTNQKPLFLSD